MVFRLQRDGFFGCVQSFERFLEPKQCARKARPAESVFGIFRQGFSKIDFCFAGPFIEQSQISFITVKRCGFSIEFFCFFKKTARGRKIPSFQCNLNFEIDRRLCASIIFGNCDYFDRFLEEIQGRKRTGEIIVITQIFGSFRSDTKKKGKRLGRLACRKERNSAIKESFSLDLNRNIFSWKRIDRASWLSVLSSSVSVLLLKLSIDFPVRSRSRRGFFTENFLKNAALHFLVNRQIKGMQKRGNDID